MLLPGFESFGSYRLALLPVNPSGLAVKTLQGNRIDGHDVVAAQLPTVFEASTAEPIRFIDLHRPACLVVCVGQANAHHALQSADLPAQPSQSAGPLVCDPVFCELICALARQPGLDSVRGGVLYTSYLPANKVPKFSLTDTARGLRLTLTRV